MIQVRYSRMFTVEPVASERLKVSPAGTVKELMLTVVHFTASLTSSRDEMLPVQLAAGEPRTAATADRQTRGARRRV